MEFHPRINMRSFIREQHQLEAQETPPSSSPAAAAAAAVEQREHMFEKVVTPSDVGKLNRLVIPKQHAERYFPLDPTSDDSRGGLLLNFEEGPTGRPWRFRYSYWNSSQSYVMTKGWSRFVKDKRLDAGDTVSFSRAVANSNRLFIDWRRRPPLVVPPQMVPTWPSTWTTVMPPPYFRHVPVVGRHVRVVDHGILESVPVLTPRRHVRLFGVNLECEEEEEEQQQPPSAELPMQWGMSAAVGTPARSYSELQLMPPTTTEEAGRSRG